MRRWVCGWGLGGFGVGGIQKTFQAQLSKLMIRIKIEMEIKIYIEKFNV